MLIKPPVKYRKHHRAKAPKQQAVASAPVLVEALFRNDDGAPDEGSDVLLTASDATGIRSADGGGPWAGADTLPLPFPA
jgi:hypothetical protein